MVGIPGTEERLALADIEDRLRRVRARFNLYTLQHNFYGLGTTLSLGMALLILGAFTLSSWLFTLIAWPLLALLAFWLLFFLRRGVVGWTDLNAAARRIDARAGLKERLSTLVAQLTAGIIGKPPPSSLWPHLLADNTDRLPEWEVKKIAPRRVPWSFLPFLASLLLALFVALVPLLSPSSELDPFSLANLQTMLSELPERMGQMIEDKMSLLPDPQDHWGGSSMFNDGGAKGKQKGEKGGQTQGEDRERELRSLAALPEELQKAIRQALQGLPDKGRDQENQGTTPPPGNRLALRPSDEQKKPNFAVEGQNLPKSKEQQAVGRAGQGGESKGGSPSGAGGNAQAPDQGSGMQRLDRARLDRKNARGQFQPDSPQIPGSEGEAGAGGPGAGSGTDPRLFGNPANLGTGAHTFQLALDSTHEKGEGSETEEKDEGGVIEKSTKNLSQRQSLDDAIRKAKIPPEYEEIVKRLFSRGESQ
ncbi:MAG TPA: hypothetical protein VGX03_12270 [Candidatus Binatia bacterium]|nr:hypothetical protein [Candidatus Binatia bacterium]